MIVCDILNHIISNLYMQINRHFQQDVIKVRYDIWYMIHITDNTRDRSITHSLQR